MQPQVGFKGCFCLDPFKWYHKLGSSAWPFRRAEPSLPVDCMGRLGSGVSWFTKLKLGSVNMPQGATLPELCWKREERPLPRHWCGNGLQNTEVWLCQWRTDCYLKVSLLGYEWRLFSSSSVHKLVHLSSLHCERENSSSGEKICLSHASVFCALAMGEWPAAFTRNPVQKWVWVKLASFIRVPSISDIWRSGSPFSCGTGCDPAPSLCSGSLLHANV